MKILKLSGLIVLTVVFNLILWNLPECEAAFSAKRLECYKDIDVRAAEVGKNYRIVVDRNIYNASQASLNDLRIVFDKKTELPYEIFIMKAQSQVRNMTPQILKNLVTKNKANVLVVDIGESGRKNNKLKLEITERNFGRRVMIEGSNDNSSWELLVKDSYIYDFTFGDFSRTGQIKWQREVDSKYMVDFSYKGRSRNTMVQYKENTFRYLKIIVFGTKNESPLSIKGINVNYSLTAEKTRYKCLIKEVNTNEEKKSSEIILDIGFKNIPLNGLKIQSGSKNYYRTLYIQGSDDMEKWLDIGRGEIFDYNIENFNNSKSVISFPETRCRYLKLIILNQDNLPIQIDSVAGIGLDRSLVFPYREKGTLRIYYGNASLEKPIFDYARYIKKVKVRGLKILPVSGQLKNSSYVFEKIKRPWAEEKPYLLWVVLIAIVMVLLFSTAAMLKKIK